MNKLSEEIKQRNDEILVHPTENTPSQRNDLFQIQLVGFLYIIIVRFQQRELIGTKIETHIRRFVTLQVERYGSRRLILFQERTVFRQHLRIDSCRLEFFVSGDQDRRKIHVFIGNPFQPVRQLFAVVLGFAQVLHIIGHKFIIYRCITVFKLTPLFLLDYFLLPQQVQCSRTWRQYTIQAGSLNGELQHIIIRF